MQVLLKGDHCLVQINAIYDSVVHWKPRLFLVPSGTVGTAFVNEITVTVFFQTLADRSSLECVCMKAIALQIKNSKKEQDKRLVCIGVCINEHPLSCDN